MFASLANKRKIDEATSAKDSVAPVYLLEELWQILLSSGPETSAGFVEYISKRLANKSPVIKQKALRLIKFLCGKGSSNFKRNISKHAGPVRELQHYRGEPDPFKGDVPNQKVRESAKEALDAMFSPTEAPSYSSSTPAPFNSRIQGFGNSNMADGPPAAPGSSKGPAGLLGFGNPRNEVQGNSGGLGNGRHGRGGYEAPGEAQGRNEGFGSMMQRVGSGALSPKAIMDSITAKGSEFLQGRRGPGMLSNDDHTGYSSDEADRGYEKPQQDNGAASSLGPLRAENGGGGGEEARIVDQICTPGGLRAQPTRDDLSVFVESAGALDGRLVAELLAEKMESTSWQAALRALCALEATIQHGSTAACGEIAVHFQTDQSGSAALETAAASPQASVRQRATRVMQLLGVGGRSAPTAAPQAQVAAAPDLLGGLDDEPRPPEGSAGSATVAAGQQDLLGDMMGQSDAGSNFAAPAAPSAAPATQAPSGPGSNLFGGLEDSGLAAGGTAPSAGGSDPFAAVAAAPVQPTSAFADGALGDLMAPAAPPGQRASAQLQAGPDVFGAGSASGATATPAADLASMFAGLSASGPGAAQPSRPGPTSTQRAASLERAGDPLSSLGLPQAQQLPMGHGVSAQRGAPNQPSQAGRPGFSASTGQVAAGVQGHPGFAGMMSQQGIAGPSGQQSFPGMPSQQAFPGMQAPGPQLQQMTPQQLQYLRQMQYMQYMQMQMMQARAMGAGYMPQMGGMPQPQFQAQQRPSPQAATPLTARQAPSGLGSVGGPLSLDALAGPGSSGSLGHNSSSSLGISQQSDFDFVGDHVKTLRGRK